MREHILLSYIKSHFLSADHDSHVVEFKNFFFYDISLYPFGEVVSPCIILIILCQQQFADTNRYWGFPTLLLLVEYLFAFVSLFPLYLTGIGGNLPDNMSFSFLFTSI